MVRESGLESSYTTPEYAFFIHLSLKSVTFGLGGIWTSSEIVSLGTANRIIYRSGEVVGGLGMRSKQATIHLVPRLVHCSAVILLC